MKRSGPIRRSQPLGRGSRGLRKPLSAKAGKRRKPTRTALRKEADRLWSKLIRERDGVCRRCGRGPGEVVLQAAHVVPRRYDGVRWDPRNGLALCLGCHKWQTEWPLEGEAFFREIVGEDLLAELRGIAIAYTVNHVGPPDYEAVIAELSNDGRWK